MYIGKLIGFGEGGGLEVIILLLKIKNTSTLNKIHFNIMCIHFSKFSKDKNSHRTEKNVYSVGYY